MAPTCDNQIHRAALLIAHEDWVQLSPGRRCIKWRWYRKPQPLSDAERFDAASRGPWGSFLLLCSMSPKRA